jgi:hypothetical protein
MEREKKWRHGLTGSVREVLQKAGEAAGHGMRVMRNHRIL